MTIATRTLPMTGTEYLGREIYAYGERVDDVTTHPAFRNAARMVARLYDGLHNPLECSLYASFDAGDHTLHLGLVEALDRAPGEPLLFHDGALSTR